MYFGQNKVFETVAGLLLNDWSSQLCRGEIISLNMAPNKNFAGGIFASQNHFAVFSVTLISKLGCQKTKSKNTFCKLFLSLILAAV